MCSVVAVVFVFQISRGRQKVIDICENEHVVSCVSPYLNKKYSLSMCLRFLFDNNNNKKKRKSTNHDRGVVSSTLC